MIIGPEFVWLHFPKCAGTLMERVLRRSFGDDPTLRFDPLDPANVIWHQNVDQREATGVDLGGKAIISGFRRLPAWVLSRIHFEKARSGAPLPDPDLYTAGRFFEEDGSEGSAEEYVRRFTTRPVDHWIRVEHLTDDFIQAFSPYLSVDTWTVRRRLRRRANRTWYRGALPRWFDQAGVDRLYESCPTWRALELSLYGDLASL